MKKETIEEFLARGGTITKIKLGNTIPSPMKSEKKIIEHENAKARVRASRVQLRGKSNEG